MLASSRRHFVLDLVSAKNEEERFDSILHKKNGDGPW
jgi:hypothetical protein